MDRIAEINARCEAATPGPWGTPENPLKQIMETGYNAGFIAHAREDIPFLLAENARLHAELAQVTEERDTAVDDLHATAAEHNDIGACFACKWGEEPYDGPHCSSCTRGDCKFEWRGPQPKAGGET